MPGTAPPGFQVELQVGVSGGGFLGGLHCGATEWRPAQVRVDDDAGGVDDPSRLCPARFLYPAADQPGDLLRAVGFPALPDALAGGVKFLPRQLHDPLAAVRRRGRRHVGQG